MLTSSSYLPKGIFEQDLYVELCDAIDKVIADNEYEFRDILNKYKDFTNQQGKAAQETLKEFGFADLIKILDLPDTTSARLGYFLSAITLLKGHKEGLILVCRLLGGNAQISEWFDIWRGHSINNNIPTNPNWVAGWAYALGDTVVGDSPVSTPAIEYLYQAITVTGAAGLPTPLWPEFLGDTVVDGGITWLNVGKAPKWEYWQANKVYTAKQHVIANSPTRFDPSDQTTNIGPPTGPNPPYNPDHNTQGRDYIFECTVGGQSGAVEPAWTDIIGGPTIDNAITWLTLDPEAYFTFNITWSFPSAFTLPNTFDYFREFVRAYVYPTLSFWIIAPVGAFQFSNYRLWQANDTTLALQDFRYPSTGHFAIRHYPVDEAYIYQCTTLVLADTGAVEPVWPVGPGVVNTTVMDGSGNTWTCRYSVSQDGLGFSDWGVIGGTTIADWQPSTGYILNDVVVPTSNNTYAYLCVIAGISDVVEPQISNIPPNSWPTAVGGTITDGTVIWECIEVGGRLAYLY